jgi:hypothetical protein
MVLSNAVCAIGGHAGIFNHDSDRSCVAVGHRATEQLHRLRDMTGLLNAGPAARAPGAGVLSQQRAIRLKRLSWPMVGSSRARGW